MYNNINDIYRELTETKMMDTYLEMGSEEGIEMIIEAIFEQDLKGTCLKSWQGSLEGYGINIDLLFKRLGEKRVLRILDDTVFLCEECGWWYGDDEYGDDEICVECARDWED